MKTLLRIAICCLCMMFSVACVSENGPTQRVSEVAVTEPTDTPTSATVPTPTPEPSSTVEATPEPSPTVEATPADETADAESEPDEAEPVAAIDITMQLPAGDPQHGEELLEAKACAGCHFLGRVGAAPSWKAEIYARGKGIATRAEERWQLDGYTGQATTPTEYLVESILMPNAYVIDGFMSGEMPQTYRQLLTDQELADIISYLLEIE